MTVSLRPAEGSDLLEARGPQGRFAGVRLVVTGPEAIVAAELDPAVQQDPVLVRELVRAAVERAAAAGAQGVVLQSRSMLLRHEARALGFGGDLRGPLHGSTRPAPGPWPSASAQPPDRISPHRTSPDRTSRLPADLLGDFAAWGLAATPRRSAGPLGRVASRLATGVGETRSLLVEWSPGRTFTLHLPDRPDLVNEALGRAAATTVAVLDRFPDHAPAVRSVYFDRSERGFATGRLAGVAHGNLPTIHINLDLVTVSGLVRAPAAAVAAPYTAVEGTVAHELWHRIENLMNHDDFRATAEMRRELGLELGVETLEQAVKGRAPGVPAAWHAASLRLAEQVSAYATTSIAEATAEMFRLWWCRGDRLPAVVARFGEVVDRLFPRPPPTR